MRHRGLLWTLAGLGAALGAVLLIALLLAPDRAALLVVAATELAAGREAALTTGLALGVPWLRAAAVTTAIEWSMLLAGAPLLVLGGDWIRERKFVRSRLARAEAYAREHPRVGILALSAMTLAPFVPVGALTAVLVGEVLTLPQRRLVPALAFAELLANYGFAFAASRALAFLPDPRAAAGIMAVLLLAIAIASAFWPRRRTETAM